MINKEVQQVLLDAIGRAASKGESCASDQLASAYQLVVQCDRDTDIYREQIRQMRLMNDREERLSPIMAIVKEQD